MLSEELRLGVKDLPDYELAGIPRNASRREPMVIDHRAVQHSSPGLLD